MIAHTPGPWITNSSDYVIAHMGALGHCGVALIHNVDGKQAANARLIAAAPELLAALEQIDRLSRTADRGAVDVPAMLGDIARSAIVKAKS